MFSFGKKKNNIPPEVTEDKDEYIVPDFASREIAMTENLYWRQREEAARKKYCAGGASD